MFATWRSGDWRQSFATPSAERASPSDAARLYSTPLSEFAQAETWFATPFSETAAPNRSDVPISQWTMKPP